MLMIPGGAYATPVFFALSIIMKVRRKPKSPETSPSLLFQKPWVTGLEWE